MFREDENDTNYGSNSFSENMNFKATEEFHEIGSQIPNLSNRKFHMNFESKISNR